MHRVRSCQGRRLLNRCQCHGCLRSDCGRWRLVLLRPAPPVCTRSRFDLPRPPPVFSSHWTPLPCSSTFPPHCGPPPNPPPPGVASRASAPDEVHALRGAHRQPPPSARDRSDVPRHRPPAGASVHHAVYHAAVLTRAGPWRLAWRRCGTRCEQPRAKSHECSPWAPRTMRTDEGTGDGVGGAGGPRVPSLTQKIAPSAWSLRPGHMGADEPQRAARRA